MVNSCMFCEIHLDFPLYATETLELLATVLCDRANNRDRKLDKQDDKFKSCHVVLANEKVMDLRTKRFHNNFLNDIELSEEGKELNNMIISRLMQSWKFKFSDIATFKNPKNFQK